MVPVGFRGHTNAALGIWGEANVLGRFRRMRNVYYTFSRDTRVAAPSHIIPQMLPLRRFCAINYRASISRGKYCVRWCSLTFSRLTSCHNTFVFQQLSPLFFFFFNGTLRSFQMTWKRPIERNVERSRSLKIHGSRWRHTGRVMMSCPIMLIIVPDRKFRQASIATAPAAKASIWNSPSELEAQEFLDIRLMRPDGDTNILYFRGGAACRYSYRPYGFG